MRLLGRVLWVLLALMLASTVAALILTVGLMRAGGLQDLDDFAVPSSLGIMVGLTAVAMLGYALIPAALIIAFAEGYRLRSLLFYAAAGGAAALLCYGWGANSGFEGAASWLDAESELVAASGIAAGMVYWLLAGRRAGAWRDRPLAP